MESTFIYEAPAGKMCHAATIAETPSGLVAAWFAGTREGAEDVKILLSCHLNGEWTASRPLVEGYGEFSCWNPVLCYCRDKLWLWYKTGQKPWSWRGRLATSLDCGVSWVFEDNWPLHIIGPDKNPPIEVGDKLLWGSSAELDQRNWLPRVEWMMESETNRWTFGMASIRCNHAAIQPLVLDRGDILSVYMRTKYKGIAYSESGDWGETWTIAEQLEAPNPNSSIGGLVLKNGRRFLVHNPDAGRRNRTPLVISKITGYDKLRRVATLEDSPGEYSYPTAIQASDGRIHVVYTWRREKIKHVIIEPEELR